MDWVKQWDAPMQGPPKGEGKGKFKSELANAQQAQPSTNSAVYKGNGKKRFEADPGNRLQAVERLTRSVANLAKKTARQVALLFSMAVATILCPVMPALRTAGYVFSQEQTDSLETQFQRWGCLVKGLAEDPKTPEQHVSVLRAHVKDCKNSELLRGKVLVCKVKPSWRDSDLYVVQLRVSEDFSQIAAAITETLVNAGGNLSFQPASRCGEERQVDYDMALLDSL